MRLLLLLIISMLSFQASTAYGAPGEAGQGQTEVFLSGRVVATGMGLAPSDETLSPGQKRALALRAAYVMALRSAAERIEGVAVSGSTTIKEAAIASEKILVSVDSFVRGAEVLSEEYDPESGTATVTLFVPLTGKSGIAAGLARDLSRLRPKSPNYLPHAMAAAAAGYDGLIVDVRGLGFKPAILNRVVTGDARVLFDPSMIKPGAMEAAATVAYTDTVAGAVELLYEKGARNPLTVVPTGIAERTDAVVSEKDSLLLFSANSETALFKRGRVVFVLGAR